MFEDCFLQVATEGKSVVVVVVVAFTHVLAGELFSQFIDPA